MIPGVTCEHCLHVDACMEGWRGFICRSFSPDWDAIEADPSTRRQGRAYKKRIRKRVREEIAAVNAAEKENKK